MNELITIYTIAYNEAIMLPHFVAHYRKNFPGCRIVVYNNMSDDGTKDIALSLGCEVIDYDTGGKLSDQKYLDIKNSCFETAKSDANGNAWVLICDIDEWCDVTISDLQRESYHGTTILEFEGFNMVNLGDNIDPLSITHGVRAPSYDKKYCFNAAKVRGINYKPGCHRSDPQGKIQYSENTYRCRHYKYLNLTYMISRHALFSSRMSDENKRKGWGVHYDYPPHKIREEFEEARKNAIKIL